MSGIITDGTFALEAAHDKYNLNTQQPLSGDGSEQFPLGLNVAGFTPEQVQALKQLLGVDETVLWEGAPQLRTITCSEALSNFERVRVYWTYNSEGMEVTMDYAGSNPNLPFFGSLRTLKSGSTVTTYLFFSDYQVSGATLTMNSCGRYYMSVATGAAATVTMNSTNGDDPSRSWTIKKVVGIGRKA